MARTRFLFAAQVGDPVACISLSDAGCMAGSMLGKVWQLQFDGSRDGAAPRPEMLAGFSDDGVRGLYMDGDRSFTTLMERCQIWKRGMSNEIIQGDSVKFNQLDRKNAQSVKHVLQRGPLVCVLFSMSSTVVNVQEQRHHHRAFKLFDFGSTAEVAPCDFDGECLVIADRSQMGYPPVFRVVQLERNEHMEADTIPHPGRVSVIKLWGPDCLVYVIGSSLHVYDRRKKEVRRTFKGHRAEIIAVDAEDDGFIATLSADSEVRIWNSSGDCLEILKVPEATFFLGYPYFVCARGRRVLLSSDEGVFLVELPAEAAQP